MGGQQAKGSCPNKKSQSLWLIVKQYQFPNLSQFSDLEPID